MRTKRDPTNPGDDTLLTFIGELDKSKLAVSNNELCLNNALRASNFSFSVECPIASNCN